MDLHYLNVMFISDDHGSSTLQADNFHLRLWTFQTLVGIECVRDVDDLLMMIMSIVKKTICWEFCHMILISASDVIECVVDV